MSKFFKRVKHTSAWLVICAVIIALFSPVKALAADYTVLNVELNELDFSQPLLVSGTEGAPGAVYLYDHVITKDGIDVDAVIKVVSKSSPSTELALKPFDSEGSGQNPKRFEPIINSPSGGGSFTFEVSFWESNTYQTANPVSVYLTGFALTGVDIDGNMEYAADDTVAATEDIPKTINTSDLLSNDTDADDDTLTIISVSDPDHGTAVLNPDGTITYTPDADYNGTDTFMYTVSDGRGGTNTATVTVTVTPANDAPVVDDTETGAEDNSSNTITELGNDTDAGLADLAIAI